MYNFISMKQDKNLSIDIIYVFRINENETEIISNHFFSCQVIHFRSNNEEFNLISLKGKSN